MKKNLLISIVFVSSFAHAEITKLNVFCEDAPRGRDVYQADSVRFYNGKLLLEQWNQFSRKYEVKTVLAYKDCTVQAVMKSGMQ